MLTLPVRDYLYLDVDKLHDYMSSIDPGALQEIKSTTRQEVTGDDAAAVFNSTQSGNRTSEEIQERRLSISDRHLFARFHEALKDQMPSIDEYSEIDLDKIERNSLVEVTREFERSPLTEMIESLLEVAELMQRMGSDEQQKQQAREMSHMMAFLMRDTSPEGKSYPMVAESINDSARVLFIAQRRGILRNVHEFEGEMTLVGKVAKKVPAGGSVDLFDFLNLLPRSMRRMKSGPKSMKDVLLEMFAAWPDQMGGPLGQDALKVAGPAVVISPLAVFT